MRIEKVHAHAFGAFRGRQFEFAPGLNIVYGRNEAGKSTLHGALYAALCGLRRGKGKNKEEQAFEDRHRPWGATDAWKVTAVVQLEDGRKIELVQDLDDRAYCKATDAVLGRDYTNEILNDGTPDASQWLGLGRAAFLATSCVRQAELLAVRDDPKALQESLQRAAASSEGQATAAQAIARLEEFRREQVGIDKVNAVKPLRRSKEEMERAEAELQRAERAHDEYERLLQREQDLLVQLYDIDPTGSTTPGAEHDLAAEDDFASRAQNALAAWSAVAPPADLAGPSAEELRREIDSLHGRLPLAVARTVGGCLDTSVAGEIDAAAREFAAARAGFEQHASTRPEAPGTAPGGEAGLEEIRGLAAELAQSPPSMDAQAESELQALRAKLHHGRRAAARWGTTAAILAIVAVALIVSRAAIVQQLPGILPGAVFTTAAGFFLAAFGAAAVWQRQRAASGEGSRTAAELQRVEVLLESQRSQHAAWDAARERARQTARVLHLPDDSQELYALATARAAWEQASLWVANWESVLTQHMRRVEPPAVRLQELLRARGISVGNDPLAGFEIYRQGCEVRARERELRTQIEQRVRDETARGRALEQRRQAEERLHRTAELRGLAAVEADSSAAALKQWLADHRERLRLRDQVQAIRDELQKIRGQIEERERGLPSVADAEEAHRAAVDEHGRVQRLDQLLDTTLQFLRAAQNRIHQDIAPVLNEAVRRWLKDVTAGRYDDVRIDPESLEVQAHETQGEWRPAALLSHGTAEQIYLLLRVALAEHLVRRGEVSPLLLDDVTVQFDRERKLAVLEALRILAATRQVILLTQEDEVREWAPGHLQPERDALQELKLDS